MDFDDLTGDAKVDRVVQLHVRVQFHLLVCTDPEHKAKMQSLYDESIKPAMDAIKATGEFDDVLAGLY
jgi:hypothetical protein